MTRTSRTMLNNSSNCGHPRLVALYLWWCSVAKLCLTLRSFGLQHASLPCPSLSPRVCSNSCPLCWGCHPTITSSVNHFSSCSVLNLSQYQENYRYQGNISCKDGLNKGQKWYGPNRSRRY